MSGFPSSLICLDVIRRCTLCAIELASLLHLLHSLTLTKPSATYIVLVKEKTFSRFILSPSATRTARNFFLGEGEECQINPLFEDIFFVLVTDQL